MRKITKKEKEELLKKINLVKIYCDDLGNGRFPNSEWTSSSTMALAESVKILSEAIILILQD